jgi:peptidoglycan-associated lipoprotein
MISLRIACGLLPLAWLAMSGCGGSSKTAPADSTIASTPPPAPVEEPVVHEEPTATATLAVVPPALEPIHFDFNAAQITPSAQLVLQNVSVVMKEHPDWTMSLEGHCDERGTDAYNVSLGEKRASAAKSYLVSLGIDGERCETVSYGETRPIAFGSGEDAWSKNRRAEFRLHSFQP